MMKALAVALSGALVAACAVPSGNVAQAMPTAYNAGAQDGCSAGESAAGNPWRRFTKDPQRYADDAMYKQGWDDGMVRCKGQYEAIGRALR